MGMRTIRLGEPLPDGWQSYRQVPLTEAVQLTEDTTIFSSLRDPLKGSAGDWLIRDIRGYLAIIPDDIFQESYVSVGWGDISPTRNPATPSPLPVSANP